MKIRSAERGAPSTAWILDDDSCNHRRTPSKGLMQSAKKKRELTSLGEGNNQIPEAFSIERDWTRIPGETDRRIARFYFLTD